MSTEIYDGNPFEDHKDSVLYMMMRREINELFAADPVDFNAAGLKAGQLLLGRCLTPEDTVVDIGSSTGQMIAHAALVTGVQARIVCVEPDREASEANPLLNDAARQRINFVRGVGEALPLADNSAEGASLHNVIFRSSSATAMLEEVKRVVKPGGFVALSSNARGHATYRHKFERFVAEKTNELAGYNLPVPPPPAEGFYLEDLPDLIKEVGGLELIDDLYVSQNSQAVITEGIRLEEYLDSIKYSVVSSPVSPEDRKLWRRIVDEWVRPYILENMVPTEQPFFADPIHRGMYVMRNLTE